MSFGMIFLTSLGLFVGLGVLYLAWRFVDSQPSESDLRSPPPKPRSHVPDDGEDQQKPGRLSPSTVLALVGMTLGLAAILFVLFFGPSSPFRL